MKKNTPESKWPIAFKHRVLGAILLVALAVIFIPALLNGTPPPPRIQRTNIPPQPKEPTPLAITEPSVHSS